MSSLVTFSRRQNRRASPDDSADTDRCSRASTYITAPSVLTPSPLEHDENAAATSTAKAGNSAGAPANRWRRKNAAERQEAERRQHLAEMRAYFEEVDAFELAVETPPAAKPCKGGGEQADSRRSLQQGVAQALAAAAPTPGSALRQRPMSLGLSRRRSSAVAWSSRAVLDSSTGNANQSPLKLSMPPGRSLGHQLEVDAAGSRRSTLLPAGMHRLSVAADNADLVSSPAWAVNRRSLAVHGRRSSVAPSRLSGTGSMLSRLSVGLSDALQWLGIKGRIPAAAGTVGMQRPALADSGDAAAQGRPMLSPIASPRAEDSSAAEGGAPPAPGSMRPATEEQAVAANDNSTADAGPTWPRQLAGGKTEPAAGQEQQHQLVAATQGQQEAAGLLNAPGAAAAAEQLGEQLATKLQLHEITEEDEADVPADLSPAAAEVEVAVPEPEPTTSEVAAPPVELEAAPEQALTRAAAAAEALSAEKAEEMSPLQQLLLMCGQEIDAEQLPCMDKLLGRHVDLKKVRKIGEGTFGEAFKAGSVVLKIVPMEGSVLVNGEPQKRAEEILAEVSVTLTLSRLNGLAAEPGQEPANMTSGFVETYGVGVCRGAYSEALRQEWHRWDKENESENEAVDIFCGDQLFVVFVVADGGSDLEHVELRSFEEVRSVLLQTTLAVAVAEEACQFEHRDLHWGNLLIRRSEEPASTAAVRARLRGVDLAAATDGVTVTLIDFTLSRLVTVTGEVAFCDLAADPELFKGPKGNVQAETYRRMKKATNNSWEAHVPVTNVFWMQYLVDICMTEKKGWACSKQQLNELRAFKRRVLTYPSCAELLFDEFLRQGLVIQHA